jgi:hypothetical protein
MMLVGMVKSLESKVATLLRELADTRAATAAAAAVAAAEEDSQHPAGPVSDR